MSIFNKHVGKFIDKAKADKLKSNWKKTKILTQSSFVGADILAKLLNKPGAEGIRIYYGVDDEGNMQPVITACDGNGNPIDLGTDEKTSMQFEGADASVPCPPYCPPKDQ